MSERNTNNGVIRKKRYTIKSDWNDEENNTTKNIVRYPYGDRFIPLRCTARKYQFNKKRVPVSEIPDLLQLCRKPNYWKERLYNNRISNMLTIKPGRIIKLTDHESQSEVSSDGIIYYELRDSHILPNHGLLDWECSPRCKPLASVINTFNLSNLDTACYENMIDWSVAGKIVVIVGNRLLICSSDYVITSLFEVGQAHCVSFSPCGKYLAIGRAVSQQAYLDVWVVDSDEFYILAGLELTPESIEVMCITWTHNSQQLLCGLSCGTIYIIGMPDLHIAYEINKHIFPISSIIFSANMVYVASCDTFGNIVILNWPLCRVTLYVKSAKQQTISFDWHPWKDNELVIAKMVPACILLLNVESKKIIANYQQSACNIAIHKVTFNKMSGELLVGLSSNDNGNFSRYKILVLGALDRVVDILQLPDEDVRFLVWNPDGTQLATAGSDDVITIWKFCLKEEIINQRLKHKILKYALIPYNKKKSTYKCFNYKSRIHQDSVHPIESGYGRTFRKWSRLR